MFHFSNNTSNTDIITLHDCKDMFQASAIDTMCDEVQEVTLSQISNKPKLKFLKSLCLDVNEMI